MTTAVSLRLLLVYLTVTCSLSYVLRRRNWNDDAERGLAEALPVLREERRRLEERPLEGGSYWGDVDDSDQPLDIAPRLGIQEKELLDALLGDNDDDGYYESEDDSINDDLESNDQVYSATGIRRPVDMSEIQDILEPSDDEKGIENEERNKKNIPVALGGPGPDKKTGKRDLGPLLKKKKRKESDDKEVVLTEEMNAILRDAVDAAEKEAAEDEEAKEAADSIAVEEDISTPHPVSADELKAVLGDDDDDDKAADDAAVDGDVIQTLPFDIQQDDDDDEDDDDDNQIAHPWSPPQEEYLPPFSYTQGVPAKIKRSGGRRPYDFEDKSDDTDGALAREYIKRFLELEDDENTNLANALNLATMAQVERTDKFVIPEAKFIRKAIHDEETIRALKASLSLDEDEDDVTIDEMEAEGAREEEEDEDEDETGDTERVLKRGEPIILGEDVDLEDDEDNTIDEDGDDQQLTPYIAAKLRQYLLREGALERENVVDDSIPSFRGEEWLDRPVDADSEGLRSEDWELNPFLRDLYQRYRAGELGSQFANGEELDEEVMAEPIKEEEEIAEEEEEDIDPATVDEIESEIEDALVQYLEGHPERAPQYGGPVEDADIDEGICPALELVDGCRYATQLGLNLDAEAMDLCNRHQLCYTCGAAHGMTTEDCDNGYISEVDALCDLQGGSDCTSEAAGLFVLMLDAHKYRNARETPAVCRNTCAVEYIIGETAK